VLRLRHEELIEDGSGSARRADVIVRHVHVQVLEGAPRDARNLIRERLHLLQVQTEDVRKPSGQYEMMRKKAEKEQRQ
jgi:hypothetical protein